MIGKIPRTQNPKRHILFQLPGDLARTEHPARVGVHQYLQQHPGIVRTVPPPVPFVLCVKTVHLQRIVRSHETETEYTPPLSSRPVRAKVLRYELTDNGKTFYREKDRLGLGGNKQVQGDLCYGQQALDKIIKWEEPTAVGDSKEASVFYTYKIENLAEWAKTPDIQRVFPGIVSTIDGAGKTAMNQALTLTNQGWQTKGLDNPF